MFGCFRHVRVGINQHGTKTRIIIGVAMQQKEARLRGYGNTDFIGDNQTVTSLESLFRKKDNHMPFEFSLVFHRQAVEKRQAPLNDLLPLRRKWSGLQLSATPTSQEAKHNLSSCALAQRCLSVSKSQARPGTLSSNPASAR